jgi:hypothetical protein
MQIQGERAYPSHFFIFMELITFAIFTAIILFFIGIGFSKKSFVFFNTGCVMLAILGVSVIATNLTIQTGSVVTGNTIGTLNLTMTNVYTALPAAQRNTFGLIFALMGCVGVGYSYFTLKKDTKAEADEE